MNSVSFTQPRFQGKLERRIKKHRKHVEVQTQRANARQYNQALEAYSANPELVEQFLSKPVYKDQFGPFTGKDLLHAIHNRLRSEKILQRTAITILALMVVTAPALLDPEIRKFMVKEEDFVGNFAHSVQDKVQDALDEMKTLGLLEELEPGKLKAVTPFGKRFLK